MALLGISVDRLSNRGKTINLPAIDSWYQADEPSLEDKFDDDDDEAAESQMLIDHSEAVIKSLPQHDRKELGSLSCAALVLTANDMMKACVTYLQREQ